MPFFAADRSRLVAVLCVSGLLGFGLLGCSAEPTLLDSYKNTESSVEATNPKDETDGEPANSVSLKQAIEPVSVDAFHAAALEGAAQEVQQAVTSGVDVNAADVDGRTALMLASFNGHSEIVSLLLKKKAKVDLRDATDRTALIYAASGKNAETVKRLLAADADINAADNVEKWTALMFAAGEGNTEVVKVLLQNNADMNLADVDGETALQFAESRGHQAVAAMLRKHAGQ